LGRARRHRRQRRQYRPCHGKARDPLTAQVATRLTGPRRSPRRGLHCRAPLATIPQTSILRREVASSCRHRRLHLLPKL
jgi:hypothetical protein